ncbi:hypothetical protein B0H14DRAFT_3149474 [Mycena olivaceomarginata]|nr:hypothetical protein B0H14DRAFT_3149474 [Mycena olivaceomarginata]
MDKKTEIPPLSKIKKQQKAERRVDAGEVPLMVFQSSEPVEEDRVIVEPDNHEDDADGDNWEAPTEAGDDLSVGDDEEDEDPAQTEIEDADGKGTADEADVDSQGDDLSADDIFEDLDMPLQLHAASWSEVPSAKRKRVEEDDKAEKPQNWPDKCFQHDERLHRPLATVPLSSDSALPAVCPAPYCKDTLPKDPGNELISLFAKKQELVAKKGKNAPGAGDLTRQICHTIKLHNRRVECIRLAKLNGWPTHIHFDEFPDRIQVLEDQILELIGYKVHGFCLDKTGSFSVAGRAARCGYFGPYGQAVISSIIERYLEEVIHPNQIHQTITNLHDTPAQWDSPDEDFALPSARTFIHYILSPFVAAKLIEDDFEVDFSSALDIMRNSSDFGDFFHTETSISPVTSPVSTPVKKLTKQTESGAAVPSKLRSVCSPICCS